MVSYPSLTLFVGRLLQALRNVLNVRPKGFGSVKATGKLLRISLYF